MRILKNAVIALLSFGAVIIPSRAYADNFIQDYLQSIFGAREAVTASTNTRETLIDSVRSLIGFERQREEDPLLIKITDVIETTVIEVSSLPPELPNPEPPVVRTRSGDRIVTSSRPQLIITPLIQPSNTQNLTFVSYSREPQTDITTVPRYASVVSTYYSLPVDLENLIYTSNNQPWNVLNQWLLSGLPSGTDHIDSSVDLNSLPVDREQFLCLATNIYFEARGSSYDDQRSVALVTLNRARHWRWAGSICDVVWERWQFSWTITADRNNSRVRTPRSWTTSQLIAYEILTGGVDDITEGATNYYNPAIVRPRWASMAVNPLRIGAHRYMQLTTTTNYEHPDGIEITNRSRLYSRAIGRILAKM